MRMEILKTCCLELGRLSNVFSEQGTLESKESIINSYARATGVNQDNQSRQNRRCGPPWPKFSKFSFTLGIALWPDSAEIKTVLPFLIFILLLHCLRRNLFLSNNSHPHQVIWKGLVSISKSRSYSRLLEIQNTINPSDFISSYLRMVYILRYVKCVYS